MIIGISGRKFSGKSTVATLLFNATGYKIVSFADKLKDVTCLLSGCTREQLEDYDFKENSLVPAHLRPYCGDAEQPTYRAFLQHFGSEFMRSVNDSIWIDCTLANAGAFNLIISDVRFPNEAKAIKDRGGIIIKVVRDGIESNDTHCSETSINEIIPDFIVHNDSSMQDLVFNIDTLVRHLRLKNIL